MRVVVVTLANHIDAYLSVTNPALDICAFVADEPEPAKAIAAKFNRNKVPFFPYYRLKECLDGFYFDYVINASRISVSNKITEDLMKYNVPTEKLISLFDLDKPNYYDGFAKLMSHYKQHPDHYKMFATGISYFNLAIDIQQFTLPTLSFARDSQDIYYDYRIAREVIHGGGVGDMH